MFWGIYRVDLFSLVPIARERVLEAMETGVIVVNEAGRVVDLNPACYRMFSIKAGVGALLKDISLSSPPLSSKEAVDQHQDITCRVQGEERYHKVAVSAITDQRGHVRGTVMAITDITALKQVQARLILEQQEAAIAQERARFTQDLHDNLGQTLAFSSVQVRAVRRELDRGNAEKANEYLRRLGEVLHQVQREMRDYVHGMRTREYENTSLPVLLEKQANSLKEHGGFSPESVVLELPEHTFGLNEKVQICQIVKEAFNNILMHSSATRVWVQLQPGLENWVLSIRDNGVGFDTNQVLGTQQGGFGLSILSERAKVLGGKWKSSPSQAGRKSELTFPATMEVLTMRIMIVDDHPLYVEGLKNLLQEDFEIVSAVSTGFEAVEEARRTKPDVILMDINMPGLDGIAATREILSKQPEIKILMLTSFGETDTLYRAIRAGAVGYLLKDLEDTEIIWGLKELQKGRNPFSPGLENLVLEEFRRQADHQPSGQGLALLNERQIEVLDLVAQGLEYVEVGKRLFISERTVKYHMANIREILQLPNQAQIVAWAWEHGLGKTVPK